MTLDSNILHSEPGTIITSISLSRGVMHNSDGEIASHIRMKTHSEVVENLQVSGSISTIYVGREHFYWDYMGNRLKWFILQDKFNCACAFALSTTVFKNTLK